MLPTPSEVAASPRPAPRGGVRRLPPGPRGLPIVGHLREILSDSLGFLTRLARDYGDVALFRLPGQEVFLVSHPDAIDEVLRARDEGFVKDEFTRRLSLVVGNGLLTSEGAFWRRQRKLAQPAFHHQRVRAYADVMVRHAREAAARLPVGTVVDVHQAMARVTLDIVAETLFGADVEGAAHEIGRSLDLLTERFSGIGAVVPIEWPTPANRAARRSLERIDDVVYAIIRRRRQGEDTGDLLSMLLRATEGADDQRMSDRQLRDEVVTLLLAGHETTALALTFALHLLSEHPDVQARLAEEVARVLGDRPATYADLGELRYADSVIRETMRLYPPAWALGREATAPFRVGGYDAAPGTQIWLAQWVVHRDPRFFPEPLAFRPERWTEEFVRGLPRSAYFPFGGGPRICIGNAFATMEAVLVLATLVQRVRVEKVSSSPPELVPSVTLRPKGGLPLRIRARTAT